MYAMAPSWIAVAISCISGVPSSASMTPLAMRRSQRRAPASAIAEGHEEEGLVGPSQLEELIAAFGCEQVHRGSFVGVGVVQERLPRPRRDRQRRQRGGAN